MLDGAGDKLGIEDRCELHRFLACLTSPRIGRRLERLALQAEKEGVDERLVAELPFCTAVLGGMVTTLNGNLWPAGLSLLDKGLELLGSLALTVCFVVGHLIYWVGHKLDCVEVAATRLLQKRQAARAPQR